MSQSEQTTRTWTPLDARKGHAAQTQRELLAKMAQDRRTTAEVRKVVRTFGPKES